MINSLFPELESNNIFNHNHEYQLDGLQYLADFISPVEHDLLLNAIDTHPWLDDLKRRVQHYGYKYDYKQHKVNHSMKIADLPPFLKTFADRLQKQGFFNDTPDQVIVNEYLPGQGITDHIDCPPCFADTVASLSLGSTCVMNFTNKDNKNDIVKYLLEKNSIVILKGNARYNWKHGIKMVKNDKYFGNTIKRQRRVSLTFRKVIVD